MSKNPVDEKQNSLRDRHLGDKETPLNYLSP